MQKGNINFIIRQELDYYGRPDCQLLRVLKASAEQQAKRDRTRVQAKMESQFIDYN